MTTRINLTAALTATALAAAIFISYVPVASADTTLPPMPGILGRLMVYIQPLSDELQTIEATISGFANSFTTKQLTFTRGQGNEIDVQTLCIGSTCIDEAQLQSLLGSSSLQNSASVQNTAALNQAVPTTALAASSATATDATASDPSASTTLQTADQVGASTDSAASTTTTSTAQ